MATARPNRQGMKRLARACVAMRAVMLRRARICVLASMIIAAAALGLGACASVSDASEEVFGVETLTNALIDGSEAPVVQAGAHPDAFTTTFIFNHEIEAEEEEPEVPGGKIPSVVKTYGTPKNLSYNLPAGVIVDPAATQAHCSEAQLDAVPSTCPASSLVGRATANVDGFPFRAEANLYNMIPPTGKPAQFGANFAGLGFVVHIDGKVRAGTVYSLSAEANSILPSFPIYSTTVTLFDTVAETENAFLTMPTDCSGQSLVSTAEVDSWEQPSKEVDSAASLSQPVTGCDALEFDPKIKAAPETSTPSSPTGLSVDLHIPQNDGTSGLATADLKNATVTLPEGMTVNPSIANGLQTCTASQIGLEPVPNQRQTIVVNRPRAQSFTVSFEGHSTGTLPADASVAEVQAALEALPGLGSGEVVVDPPNGESISGGWVVEFTRSRAAQENPLLSGSVAESDVQTVAVGGNGGFFNLSLEGHSTGGTATGNVTDGSEIVEAVSGETGAFLDGEEISGAGIPKGTKITAAGAGTLTLSNKAEATAAGVTLSVGLPYNASDELVSDALEALSSVGSGNIVVSGGFQFAPVSHERTPYILTFTGGLGASNVETIAGTSTLTGPGAGVRVSNEAANPDQQLAIATTQQAGGGPPFNGTAPSCPNGSKIGTVTVETPLISHPLPGTVYLAAQEENPFHSLMAIYIVIDDPVTGVIVKLAGHVEPNSQTGQLTTTFENNPQIPFENLELDLFGGPRAPLVTPAACGKYTTTALLEPWSHQPAPGEAAGTPDANLSSPFEIDACSPPGFTPSFSAGTLNTQADAYSSFALTLSRSDSEQEFKTLETTVPPGLLAKLAGVRLCGNTEASTGSCPPESEIGKVTVAAGVGADPVYVHGAIYLSGPYNGGPFGVVVEVPAIAGPFNLDEHGQPVVVRGSIRINPSTAQATVVSDPFPEILRGIPLRVRSVSVTLNRPEFTFTPTNCGPMSVTGVTASTSNASASLSSAFEASNCAGLPFKPNFTVSTAGKASKADGASLDVKVTSKGGPQSGGGEANIASVKVDLPKQLPSRLETLQKSCRDATFEANPASCPEESDVGTATAVTPLLAQPLSGPAYLVSHGSAKFPDLEIVLQGEGIKLVLDGATDVKKGITSSTFRTVPDAPVSSFELKLPTGPFSVITAFLPVRDNYNLCGQTLLMPTAITGQNGAVVKQTTKIVVTGCPKAKAKTKAKAKKKARKTKKQKKK
jgi:hypothetical protein